MESTDPLSAHLFIYTSARPVTSGRRPSILNHLEYHAAAAAAAAATAAAAAAAAAARYHVTIYSGHSAMVTTTNRRTMS